jgi:hypothetical protein
VEINIYWGLESVLLIESLSGHDGIVRPEYRRVVQQGCNREGTETDVGRDERDGDAGCNTVPIEKGTETVLRATARLDLDFGSRSVIWIKLVGGAAASS